MKGINRLFLFVCFLQLVSACVLVEEEDLSKKNLVLLAPADSVTTDIITPTFWWEEIDGATGYEIQIVTPSFNSITSLVVDSTVQGNQFAFTLRTGMHQWRVRAVNTSSATEFETRTIFIDSTSNLSNQVLVLLYPADGTITKDTTITFRWQKIAFADDYRFELASPDFSNPANILSSFNQEEDSVSFFLSEGIYEWQVRAQNATSNTLFTTRRLTIDLTGPATPLLISPSNNSSVEDSVILQWTSSGEKLRDSLFVYADSLIFPPLVQEGLTENTFGFVGIPGQKYFWRVKTLDTAGNESDFSLAYKFTIL